jgi:hypothetical protein
MATQPTAYDQYMLELLNRARLNPQAEANRLLSGNLNEGITPGTITTVSKQPLAFNLKLFQSAQSHSQWLLANGVFSHTGVNGSQPATRISGAGYVGNFVGENLARLSPSINDMDLALQIARQHDNLFVDSPDIDLSPIKNRGHRVSMMNGRFREIGISSVIGQYIENGVTYDGSSGSPVVDTRCSVPL